MSFRKKPAIIAALFVSAISAILLFLLTSASSNTTLFAHDYPLLMGLNVVLIVALLLAVIVQLTRLRREYRQGVFGVRLKSRLLLMLALMAVLPGALVYGVSMQFVVNSIDSWFDVRVDRALEGGLQLARNVLDGQLAELREQTAGLATQLNDTPDIRPARLEKLREQTVLQSLSLLSPTGRVLVSALPANHAERPAPRALTLTPSQIHEIRQKRGMTLLEDDGRGGLLLRALVPLNTAATSETHILQATRAVPAAIAQSANSVEAAYRDYQELSLGR